MSGGLQTYNSINEWSIRQQKYLHSIAEKIKAHVSAKEGGRERANDRGRHSATKREKESKIERDIARQRDIEEC